MTAVKRHVRFLTAAKSMRRPFVGLLARSMNSIPVERPQDLAKEGAGLIVTRGDVVEGSKGTRFTRDCEEGHLLFTTHGQLGSIAEIVSDTELRLNRPVEEEVTEAVKYKVAPKVEHDGLYRDVFGALKSGTCVAIFPEGAAGRPGGGGLFGRGGSGKGERCSQISIVTFTVSLTHRDSCPSIPTQVEATTTAACCPSRRALLSLRLVPWPTAALPCALCLLA